MSRHRKPGCPDDPYLCAAHHPVHFGLPAAGAVASFPGAARIRAISFDLRWLSQFRRLTPQREEKEQNVFANFVGREQLSDAVEVDCDFILANFH